MSFSAIAALDPSSKHRKIKAFLRFSAGASALLSRKKSYYSELPLNKSAGMTTPIAHIAAHSIFMQKRIRAAMVAAEMHLLQGMVEADETYIGGKPRKGKIRSKNKELPPPPPRIIREVAELVKHRLSVQLVIPIPTPSKDSGPLSSGPGMAVITTIPATTSE